MEIYQPEEDSYLFADFLKKYLSKHKVNSCLDMGTGSGILSETVSNFLNKKNILAADINPDAVRLLKKRKFNAVKTNLFKQIDQIPNPKSQIPRFDLITFNAPYLPQDPREPKSSQVATTGGKRGDEISVKFIRQAKKHLNKNGKIFLLISSLTPMGKIGRFKHKIVARKKIFMEELLILEIK